MKMIGEKKEPYDKKSLMYVKIGFILAIVGKVMFSVLYNKNTLFFGWGEMIMFCLAIVGVVLFVVGLLSPWPRILRVLQLVSLGMILVYLILDATVLGVNLLSLYLASPLIIAFIVILILMVRVKGIRS